MTELAAAFVRALDEDRDLLNLRYLQRQRSGQRIDPTAFLWHVEQALAPLVARVEACLPERTRGALVALYEVSLDLFAASQLGPDARLPAVQRLWREVLPHVVPRVLALYPQQVAGCLSNAVVQIGSQRGARPDDWLTTMAQLAPHCASLGELLDVGKVAAWQAGMVQYRQAALEVAGKLRPELAGRAIGLRSDVSPAQLAELLTHLREHHWLSVSAAQQPATSVTLRCVALAGSFTGFGGLFARPPLVFVQAGRFITTDQQSTWEMLGDAYGVWFCRVGGAASSPPTRTNQADVTIDRQGIIRWGKLSLSAPQLAATTSIACDGQTLAVTIPTSHHVFLYSRTERPV